MRAISVLRAMPSLRAARVWLLLGRAPTSQDMTRLEHVPEGTRARFEKLLLASALPAP